MDKKFNRKTIQEDFKAIHGKDTTADKKLVGYLFLLELRGNKLEEMTYREILEEGKKIESDLENDFSSKK